MSDNSGTGGEYVVVARRYRPQTFDDLIGQQQVTQALKNAIETNRVGHAYLFTGARGVGKTSAARILSKCLNCTEGPAAVPCNTCDICKAISTGDDVDVLEIDGASNRGIDEIRQLRSNVGIRPSRARFKIYIIDEVHMLTKEAFNALLKTLEEPPDHVKFIFCTTDPEKIPITVLSRCQRFDFAPIASESIVARLQDIVRAEGATADTEALELLARRAGGSMRDSQSMLEQVISFSGDHISVDTLHDMLGTARSHRLSSMVDALFAQDAATTLAELDAAVQEGVDVGQLAEQLLGYFRDMMSAGVGCEAKLMRHSTPAEFEQLKQLGETWGVPTLLAAAQILDQTIARMRQSLQRRTLVELAMVRISQLAHLHDLATVVSQLQSGQLAAPPVGPTPPQKKKLNSAHPRSSTANQADAGRTGVGGTPSSQSEPAKASQDLVAVLPDHGSAGSPARELIELNADSAARVWEQSISQLEGLTADAAREYESVRLDGEHQLTVTLKSSYHANRCRRPEQKSALEAALANVVGRPITLALDVKQQPQKAAGEVTSRKSQPELIRESYTHPLVKQAMDLFGADVTNVQESHARKKAK